VEQEWAAALPVGHCNWKVGQQSTHTVSSPQARNMAQVGGAGPVRPADDAAQEIADKVSLMSFKQNREK